MGIGGIGPLELVIVLVIALIILGPKRLPEAGRSVGRGMREFKDSLSGKSDDRDEDDLLAGRPLVSPAEKSRATAPESVKSHKDERTPDDAVVVSG